MKITHIGKNILSHMKGSALFSGFSEKELAALDPLLKPVLRQYSKDNIVINEGEATDQIAYVVSGRIVAQKLTKNGQDYILSVFEAGDSMCIDTVFSSYKTSPLTYIAVSDCAVLFISSACFFDHSSDLSMRIIGNAAQMLADTCIRFVYKTDVLSKRPLRDRIMTYFLIMQKKNESNSFYVRMTQEQFAQYLCVNRSALSRELGRLQRDGLIEVLTDGKIVLK